ncbi:hypothetical protein OSB04_028951 [Centaurea solstitialis]|uniref:Aminotransferase-like plant mobile domain-containing protein n=1 Tax=Centaurea solstitialis TaxID=347529 RepID=A0AA38SGT7_9ASTR|nr:hypothetical protein OSB04_028951 [Centaurea solstitialis]
MSKNLCTLKKSMKDYHLQSMSRSDLGGLMAMPKLHLGSEEKCELRERGGRRDGWSATIGGQIWLWLGVYKWWPTTGCQREVWSTTVVEVDGGWWRWRPETYTFHLPIGEVTVTLQDVHLMWNLRIDGEVVTGCQRTWSVAEKIETCYRLLGIEIEQGNFRGAQLKMPFLRTVLETALPDNATNEQCMQRARAYILLLLGGSIFPDGADNLVHMNLLVFLEDFDKCGGLSWGSAALACLYRNLCKGTLNDKIIVGPLMLLQLWAWSRIRATGPKYDGHALQRPFGVRWNSLLHFESVPTHSVSGYRASLCAMIDGEVS